MFFLDSVLTSFPRNELLAINQWDGIEDVSTACPTDPERECPVSGDQILSNLNFDKVALFRGLLILSCCVQGKLLAEHRTAGSTRSGIPLPCLPCPAVKDVQKALTYNILDILNIPCAYLFDKCTKAHRWKMVWVKFITSCLLSPESFRAPKRRRWQCLKHFCTLIAKGLIDSPSWMRRLGRGVAICNCGGGDWHSTNHVVRLTPQISKISKFLLQHLQQLQPLKSW